MTQTYQGMLSYPHPIMIQHPYDGSPTPVQNPLYRARYGGDVVGVPQIGMYYNPRLQRTVPHWLVSLTDLIKAKNGPGTGLVVENPGAPDEDLQIKLIREFLLPAIRSRKMHVYVPGDFHLNKNWWNTSAETPYSIYPQQLTPQQQAALARSAFAHKLHSGELLTIGEYSQLFGIPGDFEDEMFVPHCWDGERQWIDSIEAFLHASAQDALREQQQLGLPMPITYVHEDFKTALTSIAAGDANGVGANSFVDIISALYEGVYCDGPTHRGMRTVLTGGYAGEYTVGMMDESFITYGFFVVAEMPFTGTMGFESLVSHAYRLRERHGNRYLPTFEWPNPEQFGPEPVGFTPIAQTILRQELYSAFGDKAWTDSLGRAYDAIAQKLGEDMAYNADLDNKALRGTITTQEAAARKRTLQPAPAEMTRLVLASRLLDHTGKSLFWTRGQIATYLESGGSQDDR